MKEIQGMKEIGMFVVMAFAFLAFPLSGAALDFPGGRNDGLVAKVRSGEITEAKASWWGYDPVDSTEALQAALTSGVRKLVVDVQTGPWYVRPLKGVSNQEIVLEKGAVLCAKRGEFKGRLDVLLDYKKVENVRISGPGELRMWRDDYTNRAEYCWSEWRHALSFEGAKNVVIENLRISESGGDGLYVNEMYDTVVRNVTCDRNYRQGISVISAENLLIEGCTLSNTAGTAPAAGIDFEPNRNSERLVNCTMRDCTLFGNQACGILFALFYFDATTRPVSVDIERCRILGNGTALDIDVPHSPLNALKGRIAFRGCTFERPDGKEGIRIRESPDMPVKIVFEDSEYRERQAAGDVRTVALNDAWIAANYPDTQNASRDYPPRFRPEPAKQVVCDLLPGQMATLSPMYVRDGVRYAFRAERTGEVRFAARQQFVGKNRTLSSGAVVLRDDSGKTVGQFPLETISTEETVFSVKAPSAGFYTLDVPNRSGTLFLMTKAEVPVAIDLSERAVNLCANPSRCWLSVPEKSGRFALLAFGDRGEMVRMRVTDSSGMVVCDKDDISMWYPFVSDTKPASGLWKAEFLRPSARVFEDYRCDLSGLQPYLFLSAEKFWK